MSLGLRDTDRVRKLVFGNKNIEKHQPYPSSCLVCFTVTDKLFGEKIVKKKHHNFAEPTVTC